MRKRESVTGLWPRRGKTIAWRSEECLPRTAPAFSALLVGSGEGLTGW